MTWKIVYWKKQGVQALLTSSAQKEESRSVSRASFRGMSYQGHSNGSSPVFIRTSAKLPQEEVGILTLVFLKPGCQEVNIQPDTPVTLFYPFDSQT
ncbi:hypothetical protein NPIL_418551 [Nephila pilipes]|uniref:Uncharacterized protein n=1 Tax=Nephila pilipes TaxID=299642 RepID=A0A8X6IKP8_NEPPI|nr:hypothetical protein NPIL_418551 [Nephila pilipes]